MTVGLSTTVRNNECDDTVDRLNAGKVQIYDGSRPADADTAVTTQTQLAEFILDSPAFGDAAAGVASGLGLPKATYALDTSTATWARIVDISDVVYMDGSVGTSSADVIVNTTSFVLDELVNLTALSYSRPA
jgi:hypothetical protein